LVPAGGVIEEGPALSGIIKIGSYQQTSVLRPTWLVQGGVGWRFKKADLPITQPNQPNSAAGITIL
jgi:hypothetical protein